MTTDGSGTTDRDRPTERSDGGDGGTDRRRLLELAGATATAAALSGCADAIGDFFGGADEATREFQAPPPAGLSEDGIRLLGPPDWDRTEYTVEQERSADGERYLVTEHSTLTTYGVEAGVEYPIGVVTSPKSIVDGTPTNPFVAENSYTALAGAHGKQLLDGLGIDLVSGRTAFESTSGQTALFREQPMRELILEGETSDGTPTKVWIEYVCSTDLPSGLTVPGPDYSYENTVVLVGSAFQAEDSVPDERRFRSWDLLDGAADDVEFNAGWSPPNYDLSVEDPRLVQTVEDTVVEELGVTVDDPALVEDENVAPVFDLGGDGDVPWYVRVTVETEGGHVAKVNPEQTGPSTVEYDLVNETTFDIRDDDVRSIRSADDPGHAPAVLDRASREGTWNPGLPDVGEWALGLPAFNLTSDHSALSIELATPVGQPLDEARLEKGTDFETVGSRAIRVGFIPVVDPGNGKNYGGQYGFPTTYRDTVDAAVDYLYRVLPGGLVAYRHDKAFKGHRKTLGFGEYRDFREARRLLEKAAYGNLSAARNVPQGGKTYSRGSGPNDPAAAIRNEGFDVWVMIVPLGYFDHHGRDASGLYPGKHSWAVGALESRARRSVADTVGTVAQEIGHYFQGDPYHRPDGPEGQNTYPLAQRNDEDREVITQIKGVGVDLDHARHPDSNLIDGGPTDEPGIVSRGYDLTGGEFRTVPGHGYDDGNFSVDPIEVDGELQSDMMPSYMSYARGETWADNRITQDAINTTYGRGYWGNPEPMLDASGRVDDGGEVRLSQVDAYRSRPLQHTWDGGTVEEEESAREVDVKLEAPNGETVAETTVKDEHHVELHADETVEGVDLLVEFPMNTANVRLSREDAETELNPITSVLRDVIGRIPEEGFAGDPEAVRDEADDYIDDVAAEMEQQAYADAKAVLEEDFMPIAREDVRAEYDAFTGQPTSEVVVDYTERMIERLDVLAGDGPSPTPSCASLTEEYTRFDAAERTIIADFEYPALVGDLETELGRERLTILNARESVKNGASIVFRYRQLAVPEEANLDQYQEVTTIEFGGESRPVVKQIFVPDQARLATLLPYEVDGESREFMVTIDVDYNQAGNETSEACAAAIDEAARHVVESLEPNPDAVF